MWASDMTVVRTYDQLIAAFRARLAALNLAMTPQLDELAGLPDHYIAKLLAPVPIRGIGRTSLGPLLTVLGLQIVLVEDPAAIAQCAGRLPIRRDHKTAGEAMLAAQHRAQRLDIAARRTPQWGRQMRARQVLAQTPRQRSHQARRAARIRWARRNNAPAATGETT